MKARGAIIFFHLFFTLSNTQAQKIHPGDLTLKITVNAECHLMIDGVDQGLCKPGDVKKVYLKKGEYLIKAVSTENTTDYYVTKFVVTQTERDEVYEIDLYSIIKSRIEIEGSQKQNVEKINAEENVDKEIIKKEMTARLMSELKLDRNANIENIKNSVNSGADVNLKVYQSISWSCGGDRFIGEWTPLQWAVIRNSPEVLKAILDHGADVNASMPYSLTPLQIAIECYSNKDAAKLLVAKGADVNKKISLDNNTNVTYLMLAGRKKSVEIARILVEGGADIQSKDSRGEDALFYAVASREVFEFLLSKGADMNSRNNYSQTALHNAAFYGGDEVIRFLLSKGADVNNRDKNNSTPLLMAVIDPKEETIQALLQGGADVNAKDDSGTTPMHVIVHNINLALFMKGVNVDIFQVNDNYIKEQLDIAKLLIEHGADLKVKNNDGETPLSLAAPPLKKALQSYK